MQGRINLSWRCAIVIAAAWMTTCGGLGDVAAAELRKCILSNGRAAYVSEACPAGSRQAWQRAVDADPGHDAAVKRRLDEISQWQQASRRDAVRRQWVSGMRGTTRSGEGASNRCERARQRRDRIRDKEWMRMTYDRMIQLDDEVNEACR